MAQSRRVQGTNGGAFGACGTRSAHRQKTRTGGSMLMMGMSLRSRRPTEFSGVMRQSEGGRQAITCDMGG